MIPIAVPPKPTASLPQRYVVVGLLFLLGLSALVMSWWYVPGYGAGVDEASYFLAAKGLATHFDPAYHNDDPLIFVPENMVEARPGVFYPKYPIGYPLLCAAAYRIGGPQAPFLVNPVLMIAALAGAFFLSRLFLDDLLALAAAFFMALHPAILHYGVAALSHAADLACVTWCLFFVVWWYRKPHALKLFAAGILLGYAVSLRYTEAILALPVGFLWGCRFWDAMTLSAEAGKKAAVRKAILHAAVGVAGGLLGVFPLLWYQWYAFGSPLTTGYSLTGEATAFSLHLFLNHFLYALKTLLGFSTGLSVLLPLAAVGMAVAFRREARTATFLVLWCVPTLLLYSAYYWVNRGEPMLYVRFYLTLFPGLIIAALLPLKWLAGTRAVAHYSVAVAIFMLGCVGLMMNPIASEMRFAGTAIPDLVVTRLIQKSLPADAVIVVDGFYAYSLVYYTDMTVIYPPYFSQRWVNERLRPAEADRPADFNPLRRDRFAAAVGGRTSETLNEMLRQRLLKFAREGRTVGVVMFKDSRWQGLLTSAFDLSVVATDEVQGVTLLKLTPKVKAGADSP